MIKLTIDRLLTIDATGMPKAPNITQLLDKDVRELWARDNTPDKSLYIKEAGVIYYLADPKSPTRQQGLTDRECIKAAIENYDLPKDYLPDKVVWDIVKKYSEQVSGPAMKAVISLRKSLHNTTIASDKINELLNEKLTNGITDDDIAVTISYIDSINKKITEIPGLLAALRKAEDEVLNEQETMTARGGQQIMSSMIEEE